MKRDKIPDPTRIPCCECDYYWIVESDYGTHDGCDRPRKANEMTWCPTLGWHRTTAADFSPNAEGHCPHRVPRVSWFRRWFGRKP